MEVGVRGEYATKAWFKQDKGEKVGQPLDDQVLVFEGFKGDEGIYSNDLRMNMLERKREERSKSVSIIQIDLFIDCSVCNQEWRIALFIRYVC